MKRKPIKHSDLKRKYLKYRGLHCPYCDSDNLTLGSWESDDNYATCHVVCESCDRDWTDIYTLTDVNFEE